MKIEPEKIPVRELVDGYKNCEEEGVFGYGGKLNIRPPYQREFIYDEKEQNAVINTVLNKYPLNIMYWTKNDVGGYELLDGQQRTLSICKFVKEEAQFRLPNGNYMFFDGLSKEKQKTILNYELDVYMCEGTHDEKIDWFQVINIAGKKLFNQEILNAVYSGSWLQHAKKFFSKKGGDAHRRAGDYMTGTPERQEFLETTLKWISNNNIRDYMSRHQKDENANEIIQYYEDIFDWVEDVFRVKRKTQMKGVPWGELYNEFKDEKYNHQKIEKEVKK